MVPVQDLVGPTQYGVHGVVVLRYLPAVVEVGETLESLEGALEIVGLIQAVEFLQSVPGHLQTRMSIEQTLESSLVSGGEMIVSFQ